MSHNLTFIQKAMKTILPKRWADDMEADSKSWIAHCPCGHSISIWDLGGIRWKAKGNPRAWIKCRKCGKASFHKLIKVESQARRR